MINSFCSNIRYSDAFASYSPCIDCFRKVIPIPCPDGPLVAPASVKFDLWLRADDSPSVKPINFIIYYEAADESPDKIRYTVQLKKKLLLVRSLFFWL